MFALQLPLTIYAFEVILCKLFNQTMFVTLCYRQNDEHHVNDKQISTKSVNVYLGMAVMLF